MKVLIVFIALFLNITGYVNAVTYVNPEKKCKVDFPCEYETDTSSMDFPHLKVKTIRLSADEEINTVLLKYHIIYRFICEQFYPTLKNVASADLMTAMKMYSKKMNEDSFIGNNETVLEQKQSTFKGLPAIDYKLEMKESGLMECRKVIFNRNKIYALSFLCLKSLFSEEKMNAYFNTFELMQ
ncbi:MAG: hypothetical protein Q8861_02390 [Bacteroidota bacterium]|nr:hypothetical protein [Bacteroidota bacterium]